VDAQYRLDLRDMLDQRFAAIGARLDQRLAEQEARFRQRLGELELRLDRRIDLVDTRLEKMEARLLGRTEVMIGTAVGGAQSRLQGWMIGLWVSTMLVVAATRFL
jgi:hypothetical protein